MLASMIYIPAKMMKTLVRMWQHSVVLPSFVDQEVYKSVMDIALKWMHNLIGLSGVAALHRDVRDLQAHGTEVIGSAITYSRLGSDVSRPAYFRIQQCHYMSLILGGSSSLVHYLDANYIHQRCIITGIQVELPPRRAQSPVIALVDSLSPYVGDEDADDL
ncbi:hypothetical protein M9H77_10580 [Catharanthus roseus]|uniref:Uncharacterized protein n=1 Tax=Catharanthus roseus TaxID=4058 RepID=A0ACC0BC42_CATRO|nr:hypothetical protein M9H77_10580 [Catharanthus roseus]